MKMKVCDRAAAKNFTSAISMPQTEKQVERLAFAIERL